LEPFLYSLSKCSSSVLVQRIRDQILLPILENNITLEVKESEDEVEEVQLNGNGEPKWVDGGKLSHKTQKEI